MAAALVRDGAAYEDGDADWHDMLIGSSEPARPRSRSARALTTDDPFTATEPEQGATRPPPVRRQAAKRRDSWDDDEAAFTGPSSHDVSVGVSTWEADEMGIICDVLEAYLQRGSAEREDGWAECAATLMQRGMRPRRAAAIKAQVASVTAGVYRTYRDGHDDDERAWTASMRAATLFEQWKEICESTSAVGSTTEMMKPLGSGQPWTLHEVRVVTAALHAFLTRMEELREKNGVTDDDLYPYTGWDECSTALQTDERCHHTRRPSAIQDRFLDIANGKVEVPAQEFARISSIMERYREHVRVWKERSPSSSRRQMSSSRMDVSTGVITALRVDGSAAPQPRRADASAPSHMVKKTFTEHECRTAAEMIDSVRAKAGKTPATVTALEEAFRSAEGFSFSFDDVRLIASRLRRSTYRDTPLIRAQASLLDALENVGMPFGRVDLLAGGVSSPGRHVGSDRRGKVVDELSKDDYYTIIRVVSDTLRAHKADEIPASHMKAAVDAGLSTSRHTWSTARQHYKVLKKQDNHAVVQRQFMSVMHDMRERMKAADSTEGHNEAPPAQPGKRAREGGPARGVEVNKRPREATVSLQTVALVDAASSVTLQAAVDTQASDARPAVTHPLSSAAGAPTGGAHVSAIREAGEQLRTCIETLQLSSQCTVEMTDALVKQAGGIAVRCLAMARVDGVPAAGGIGEQCCAAANSVRKQLETLLAAVEDGDTGASLEVPLQASKEAADALSRLLAKLERRMKAGAV